MRKTQSAETKRFFKTACLFESSLLLIAFILGGLAGINPLQSLSFSETAIGYGILGTLPLIMLYMTLEQFETVSTRKIKKVIFDVLGSKLSTCHWSDLLVLASIAGITEEALFRGLLQPWLESHWGMLTGLIGSNLVFGLVHAITPLYIVLAIAVGIYLGLSLDYGDERNLLTPMIIHALYDFFAFIMIVRSYRRSTLL